ncbi:Sporulation protein YpeB [Lentibacillus sp. JNUCC-1]|uniref:germination protein YpeB n=1 Tax=Lentibacillus sp. JNUCC-1 TaxID=2654513 RepID=UPI0012E7702C|nr:germination protein YpeB [Lentibacillus sp. JNUCC-1]MUV39760.1 Sporulation protein YpeB [Lentibacillus sp. JNUCC-1]
MIRWILIGVLSITTIAGGIWGYQERQDKNAILIQAENNYQKSFHNLTYHMDLLHDKIGTALAMNSEKSLSPAMVEIWRLTSESLSDVGNLPLTLLPFNKTESFLADIGDFTYRTSVRNLEKDPLTDEETKALENLYKQAADIKDELREVQHLVLENNLRWMDVELALATEDEQADNTIIDGFKTVEEKVEGYSEGNIQSSVIGMATKDHEFKNISGEKLNQETALDKSKAIFKLKDDQDLAIAGTGKGADIPLYSISYKDGDRHGYMDMTQKGGHPLNILVERPIKEKKLSLNKGLEKAERYLQDYDLDHMQIFNSSEYEHIGVYSFLYNQDDIRIYPDAVEVKVALDNGDILGLTARNFYMNHHEREIPEPEWSAEEAKEQVNSNVKIQENHLAVIENDLGEEVLVHEFLGTMNDDTYRIFINALNGNEERIEKLGGTEINYEGLS